LLHERALRQALVGAALSALVPGVGQLYMGARRGVALLGKYGTTASGVCIRASMQNLTPKFQRYEMGRVERAPAELGSRLASMRHCKT
jgi:hypothetical protein